MKNTFATKQFINKWVARYVSYLDIPDYPKIIVVGSEYKKLMNDYYLPKGYTRTRNPYRYYGIASKQMNSVFLNIKLAPNRKHLRNTIAHELIHIRYKTSHSPWFRSKVSDVIRNG